MMVSATDRLSQTTAPVEARRKSDRDKSAVDANAAGAIAFDSLLNVARGSLGTRAGQMDADARLSGQMFEDTRGTAREQRGAALQEDYQRDLQNGESARYDRSGVENRSKLARQAGAGADSGRGADGAAPHTAQEPSQAPKAQFAETPREGRSDEAVTSAARLHAPPAERTNAAHSLNGTNDSRAPSVAASHGAAQLAFARAPGAVTSTVEGRATDTVAAKVGQVLGAGRAGGVESARGATAAANLPESPDPKTSTRSPSERAPSKSTRGADRTDTARPGAETAPTKFEELVRSIRMRAGQLRSSARMLLDPPELGRVQIDVRMDGEQLQIDVRTSNDDAK